MSNDVIQAYEALIALEGFRDSEKKANSIYYEYEVEKIKSAMVGEYVFYGSYEQDNNLSNGEEKIEWRVLEKNGNKVLLISKYCLENLEYHSSEINATWESCTLRSWLNNDFFINAFSVSERALIQRTKLGNAPKENDTEDKVFLLSYDEIRKYLVSDVERSCRATPYAISKHINTDDYGNAEWWLRTLEEDEDDVMIIESDGDISMWGTIPHGDYTAVRPAIWVSIEQSIFKGMLML